MRFIKKKRYRGIKETGTLLLVFFSLALASCVDDNLGVEEPAIPDDAITGDCLQFTLELSKSGATRAGDFSHIGNSDISLYDDYIDTQDKFRIFFFTDEGDFLFGATDRVVGALQNTSTTGYWYVRIPMTIIVDRENQEYDINKIKSYLKNHPFKIAILANWPNADAKINPADWDDSEGSNVGENPSSTLKGHPLWNWSNSILNIDAKPEDIRNINDLHHVYNDLYYANNNRRSVFERFMDDAKPGEEAGLYMGEPTDWVKMRDINDPTGWKATYSREEVLTFDSKVTANQWIRANWTPEVDANQGRNIYRHYQHMWFLWNFDASFKSGLNGNPEYNSDGSVKSVDVKNYYEGNWGWNDGSPAIITNRFGKEWYKRNGDLLYKWMKKSLDSGEALEETLIDIGESNNDVFFQYVLRKDFDAYARKVGDNYGIQLPAIGTGPHTTNQGMLSFQARTSGTLRVKWSSYDDTESTLAVQNGLGNLPTTVYRYHSGVSSTTPTDWVSNADGLNYLDITVEGNSEPMLIYCTSGKAVVYSIEFIRGRYLYETDREGVKPNIHQGIPMYGVQRFEAIGDWQKGTTFNLSEGDNGKNISLIRALAKVEVFIKRGFGRPRHVFMRNLNRAARCEPMDVETSTSDLWNDNHSVVTDNPSDTNNPDVDLLCEWFDIQKHGASYNTDYTTWQNWFYSSWETTKWKSNTDPAYRYDYTKGYWVANGGHKGWKNSLAVSDTENRVPHIFNPYIYRSDFCRFLEGDPTGSLDNDYYHYVLYLPEKHIDDPATAGNTSTDPRVPHIEYRFYPRDVDPNTGEVTGVLDSDDPWGLDDDRYSNSEYNLDDNDCFRIYFTNYGGSSSSSQNVNYVTPVNTALKNKEWNSATYDQYEKSRDRLNFHWPIMRNHTYKLYVGGEGPQNPEIHVEVSDWGHRKVIVKW